VLELHERTKSISETAEARFAKSQKKAAEGAKATAEYIAEARIRAAKTTRLRQLRLAKEEADRTAGTLPPAKIKRERAPRSTKGKTLASRILLKRGKDVPGTAALLPTKGSAPENGSS